MDWNWFFGALAQSAAAIVGIFGAFVITKILTNQAAYSEKLNKGKELLASCKRVLDSADDLSFGWYNKRIIEDELKDLEEMLQRDDTGTPEQYFDQLTFPLYYERKRAIKVISLVIERRRQRIERENEEARRRAKNSHGLTALSETIFQADRLHIPNIRSPGLTAQIQRERDSIDTVVRDAKHQIRVVLNFLDSVRGNPESSPQITAALALVTVLFYAGVIYPLSFLPAPTVSGANIEISISAFLPLLFSLKGALLVVISAVFTAILIMFFWLNVQLRYPGELLAELEEYTNIFAYSSYFGVMEENLRAGSAAQDANK